MFDAARSSKIRQKNVHFEAAENNDIDNVEKQKESVASDGAITTSTTTATSKSDEVTNDSYSSEATQTTTTAIATSAMTIERTSLITLTKEAKSRLNWFILFCCCLEVFFIPL